MAGAICAAVARQTRATARRKSRAQALAAPRGRSDIRCWLFCLRARRGASDSPRHSRSARLIEGDGDAALGCTVPHALGDILLTARGQVIIYLMK